MPHTVKFMTQLGLRFPIIQAPMAGGISTPKLVAAVTESGGLGSLPMGYLSEEEGRSLIRKTKELTKGAFSVNIFAEGMPLLDEAEKRKVDAMNKYLSALRKAWGMPPIEDISHRRETDAEKMIKVAIDEGIKIISFTFGLPSSSLIKELKQNNVFLIGTATCVEEAVAIRDAGLDAVIGQGYEAGGHRGSFLKPSSPANQLGTMSLIPLLTRAVEIPVIAAGGIMNGAAIAATIGLGASAAQLGTAFLACQESGASEGHRQALIGDTVITNIFTGREVRAIRNPWITEMEANFKKTEIPSYPLQHYLTQKIRVEANKTKQYDKASFWAGQASKLARALTAGQLMKVLQEEFEQAIQLEKEMLEKTKTIQLR